MKLLFTILGLSFLLISCKKEGDKEKPVIMCVTFWDEIELRVLGDSLTDFYTVRLSNLDTLKYEKNNYHKESYTIIKIENHIKELDYYQFIGKVNDSIAINEQYIIGVGDCGLGMSSGKNPVQL